MSKDTILFEGVKATQLTRREILEQVYNALEERGYNAVDQMVGYLTSGDPSYITSHNNARNIICRLERDDIVEEMLRAFLNK